MVFIILWAVLSLVIGLAGSKRKIGFFGAFLCSVVFSPIVGFAATMLSKDKQTDLFEKKIMNKLTSKKTYQEYQESIAFQHSELPKEKLFSKGEAIAFVVIGISFIYYIYTLVHK